MTNVPAPPTSSCYQDFNLKPKAQGKRHLKEESENQVQIPAVPVTSCVTLGKELSTPSWHHQPTTGGVPHVGTATRLSLPDAPRWAIRKEEPYRGVRDRAWLPARPSSPGSSDLNFLIYTITGSLPSYPFLLGLPGLALGLLVLKCA